MNCITLDLKAYYLQEVGPKEKSDCEAHLAHCESCRLELDQLRLIHSALLAVPGEEIPRRIAFVSDRVFEPKWWQTIWRSGPAMGFASAALLASAILFHGANRPVPAVTAAAAPAVQQITDEQIEAKIHTAVIKAVAEARAADQQKTTQMLAAASRKFEGLRQDLVAAQQSNRLYQQQMGRMMVAANTGGAQ